MRERVLVAACISGLMCFTGWSAYFTLVVSYFSAGDGSAPSEKNFRALLNTLEENHKLRPGATTALAELTRPDGTSVTFTVAEGTFTPSTIEPTSVWSKLITAPTLLVSSGDEILRNNGGISAAIGPGCLIDAPEYQLATGAMFFSFCKGPYAKAFTGLVGIESAIIKAWNGVGERPACSRQTTTHSDEPPDDYSKCIGDAVETALGKLWGSREISGIKTLVIPELGTGTGMADKGFFYQAVKNALEKCLIQIKGCGDAIPDRIVFAVWSNDKPQAWEATKGAVARNLESLASDWHIPFANSVREAKSARYFGILTVLLAFVVSPSLMRILRGGVAPTASSTPAPSTSPYMAGTVTPDSIALIIFGWGIAAAGISTSDALSTESLAALVPTASSGSIFTFAAQAFLGASVTILCGLIHQAAKSFEGK